MNSCALNPVDSKAYCTSSISGECYIVRIAPDTSNGQNHEFVGQIVCPRGNVGAFDMKGKFYVHQGSELWQFDDLHLIQGVDDRTDPNLNNLMNVSSRRVTGGFLINDIVIMSGDHEALNGSSFRQRVQTTSSASGDIAVFFSSEQLCLYSVDPDDPDAYKAKKYTLIDEATGTPLSADNYGVHADTNTH
jgi:hypothetical protein